MRLSKYILLVGMLLLMAGPVLGQYEYPGEHVKEEKKHKKLNPDIASRIFFSPRLGFSIWDSSAYFEIAPVMGYKLTSRFWLAAGPEYMFIKSGSYSSNVFGITSFAYFAVLDNIDELVNIGVRSIFLYAENQALNIRIPGGSRAWYDLVLGGAGARMPIGERMGISVIVVWGLNKSADLLYSNPEIRIMYDF